MMQPRPAPTVVVGLGRGNIAATLIMLAFLTGIVVICAVKAVGSDGSSRAILFLLAGVFAVPLVLTLVLLPRMVAPRDVVFDGSGLHIRHGNRIQTIAWPLIAALAIGFEYKEQEKQRIPFTLDQAKDVISERASAAVLDLLHLGEQRKFALEIYPSRPDAVEFAPKLRPYWKPQVPPAPGLPPIGWRVALPPVMSIADQIGRGVFTVAPQRWVGFVPRQWPGRT
jgi:hypothetical protein